MRWLMAMLCLVSFGFSKDFNVVMAEAKQEEKLVWVFVELPRCPWCARMRKEVLESGVYEKELAAQYAFVSLFPNEAEELGMGVGHFPTSYVIDPLTKKSVDMLPGYMQKADFVEYLKLLYEIERGDK